MKTLDELAKETIDLIVSLQKKGIKSEMIKKEIGKINDETIRMFLTIGIEAIEMKSYILN